MKKLRSALSLHNYRLKNSQPAQRVRNFLTENIGLKLLSLLLAILFFAISRQPMSEVTLVSVPLELHNLRQGLEISGDAVQTVSVRLRGPQDVVRNTMASQIGVIADLSSKEPGERVVQLKLSDVTVPENVEVLRIEPPSIRLLIEPTVQKQIPVEPHYIGTVVPGYKNTGFRADPAYIGIAGPQSHVNEITRAMTESIQLDGRRETFTTTVDVDLRDRFIRITTPGLIRIAVQIESENPLPATPEPVQPVRKRKRK